MQERSDECRINFSLVVTFIMDLSVRGYHIGLFFSLGCGWTMGVQSTQDTRVDPPPVLWGHRHNTEYQTLPNISFVALASQTTVPPGATLYNMLHETPPGFSPTSSDRVQSRPEQDSSQYPCSPAPEHSGADVALSL